MRREIIFDEQGRKQVIEREPTAGELAEEAEAANRAREARRQNAVGQDVRALVTALAAKGVPITLGDVLDVIDPPGT